MKERRRRLWYSYIILVAPSAPTIEPMSEKEKKRMLHHPDQKEAVKSVEHAIVGALSRERYQLVVNTQLVVDPKTWKWWLLKGMNHSISEEMIKLKMPITILASLDDPVITPKTIAERVLPILKGA